MTPFANAAISGDDVLRLPQMRAAGSPRGPALQEQGLPTVDHDLLDSFTIAGADALPIATPSTCTAPFVMRPR